MNQIKAPALKVPEPSLRNVHPNTEAVVKVKMKLQVKEEVLLHAQDPYPQLQVRAQDRHLQNQINLVGLKDHRT